MGVVLLVAGVPLVGGVGQWKTYTAKRNIRALEYYQGTIWAATNGGMFSYRLSDKTFSEFTTSEGLRTIDLTAIATEKTGAIWVGASNGFLHRYLPTMNSWQYIADIALLNNPQKRINALHIIGDTLFILSDIGVSVYSLSGDEFGDSYSRFGNSQNQIVGNVTSLLFFKGTIWVGTRNGIVSTPLSNPNPSAPETWQIFTTNNGLPSNFITGLLTSGDTLFAATSGGLAMYDGLTWNIVAGTTGLNIIDIRPYQRQCMNCPILHFITRNELWSYGGEILPSMVYNNFSSNLTSILSDTILGSSEKGLMMFADSSWIALIPPGPPSNKFVGIAVDEKGLLWSGTGSANGEGFMSFDGNAWMSYNVGFDSRLGTNNYYKVSIGKNNTKWISSWGGGVALVDGQGMISKVLNSSNGIPPSVYPSFVVVGGVATDRNGVVWITNRTGRGDTSLVKFHPDSSLSYVLGCGPGCRTRTPNTVFTDVVIDDYGTKWFANYSRFEPDLPSGLYYYNEAVSLPGASDGWGKLKTTDGLTSEKVWSIALDLYGGIWIGSEQGITIIFDPTNPRTRMAVYRPLRDQIIQGIAVDAMNNKWVATRQGVFVLSSDGTIILDRYTVENSDSKLLDNDVASIAIDATTGTVYFGTEKGLSALQTPALTPAKSLTELSFSPNPFYLPSPITLTIDGLVQNSLLKVLTVGGDLIREIRTPGGRIGFWDGRDDRGELVSTAVYFVVAYSEDGSQVATGKVAIVRR